MHELVIEGVIGGGFWGGIDSADVRRELNGKAGDVTVYLNSIGGSVDEGISIFNQLRRHSGTVSIVVDGVAASIASVILMAADTITLGIGAEVMIHNPWTITMGDVGEHEKAIRGLESAKEAIMAAYATRIEDAAQLSAWMDAETWFSGQAAVDAGFADAVDSTVAAKSVRIPRGMYQHTPDRLIDPNPAAETPVAWKWKHEARQRKLALKRLTPRG